MKIFSENGGDSGGPAHLTRSELKLLAREMGRYPITQEERRQAVEACLYAIQRGKNHRGRLAGVKALASLDKMNLDEDRQVTGQTVNLNVDGQVVVSRREVITVLQQAFTDGTTRELLTTLSDRLGGFTPARLASSSSDGGYQGPVADGEPSKPAQSSPG